MHRGVKNSYTNRQKRQAEHIEEGYGAHGVKKKGSQASGVGDGQQNNRYKITGGGKKSGSGRGKPENNAPRRERADDGAVEPEKVAEGVHQASCRIRCPELCNLQIEDKTLDYFLRNLRGSSGTCFALAPDNKR